jgi:VWFA-related protein
MNKKIFCPILVPCLIAALLGNAYGSRQQNGDQTLKLKAELVQFDVLVTDKNDHPVTGLNKDDFLVLDQGRPQDVSFFSHLDLAKEGVVPGVETGTDVKPPSPQAPSVDTSAGRTIFLIFDPYFIDPTTYPAMQKSLDRLINEDLLPDDQVAIFSTNGELARQFGSNH